MHPILTFSLDLLWEKLVPWTWVTSVKHGEALFVRKIESW
jgi:hypothetical protein